MSQSCGMIEERPGKGEPLTEVLRQCADTERFGEVVPAVIHVETELLGIEVRPMRTLTCHVGIQASRRGLRNQRAPRPRDDTHAPYSARTEWECACGGSENARQSRREFVTPQHQVSPHADGLTIALAERAAHRDTQAPGENRVVADVRMAIEGQVRRVDGDVVFEETRDAGVHRAGQWPRAAPEEPVVDEQEVGPVVCRELHGGTTQVDCGRELAHLAPVTDLQPVQRVGGVAGVAHPEVVVEILDDGVEAHRDCESDYYDTILTSTRHDNDIDRQRTKNSTKWNSQLNM